MRNHKSIKAQAAALALCLLLLSGCGGSVVSTEPEDAASPAGSENLEDTSAPENGTAPEPEEKPEAEPETGPEPEADPATEPEPEPGARTDAKPEPEGETIFASMPHYYLFCSGAGAWSTELTLEEDGSFDGLFVDSNMGESGDGYPGGSRYICSFSGKFTQPEQVDETTWSMEIASMELEHPADGAEEYADDVRYIYAGPYGLEEAEELLIYTPDSRAEDLPEDFLIWAKAPLGWTPTEEGTLGLWGIYNVSEGCGFVSYGYPS